MGHVAGAGDVSGSDLALEIEAEVVAFRKCVRQLGSPCKIETMKQTRDRSISSLAATALALSPARRGHKPHPEPEHSSVTKGGIPSCGPVPCAYRRAPLRN